MRRLAKQRTQATATSNDVAVDEGVVAKATANLDAEYEALCLDAAVLV